MNTVVFKTIIDMNGIDDIYLYRHLAFRNFVRETQDDHSAWCVQRDVNSIKAAYERGDIKFIKAMDKELSVTINHYSLSERKRIYQLIEELTGERADFEEEKRQKKLNTILKRGKIINRDEYELVHSEIDLLLSDPNERERAIQLDKIMMKYSTSLEIE